MPVIPPVRSQFLVLAALCVDFGPFSGRFWPISGHFGAILVPHQANFGVFEHNSGHVRVVRLTWGVHTLTSRSISAHVSCTAFSIACFGPFWNLGVFDQNTFPVHFGLDL